MTSRFCRRQFLVISMRILLVAAIASAADVRPSVSQEWDAIVQRAEEEGQVAVYATDSIGNAQMIWTAFQKRYPKIKLVGTTLGRGSDLFPKLFGERRAGKFLADVFLGAPSAVYLNLYRAKIVEPIPPILTHPSVTDLSKWWMGKHHYIDPEGQYVFMYRERFVRTADSVQHEPHQRERDQIGVGSSAIPMEGKISGTPSRSDPGLHRTDLRLPSSPARAEVHRTYLPRYGTNVLPRHPPRYRLVITGEVCSLLSL